MVALPTRARSATSSIVGDTPTEAKALLVRGLASVDIVNGVPDEYVAASTKVLGADQVTRARSGASDLRRDLDLELALDVLGGPLFYRLLITGGPIDARLAEGVVELILRGFAPAKSRPSKSPHRKKERRR